MFATRSPFLGGSFRSRRFRSGRLSRSHEAAENDLCLIRTTGLVCATATADTRGRRRCHPPPHGAGGRGGGGPIFRARGLVSGAIDVYGSFSQSGGLYGHRGRSAHPTLGVERPYRCSARHGCAAVPVRNRTRVSRPAPERHEYLRRADIAYAGPRAMILHGSTIGGKGGCPGARRTLR